MARHSRCPDALPSPVACGLSILVAMPTVMNDIEGASRALRKHEAINFRAKFCLGVDTWDLESIDRVPQSGTKELHYFVCLRPEVLIALLPVNREDFDAVILVVPTEAA